MPVSDDFWREVINSTRGEFVDGDGPPSMEMIEPPAPKPLEEDEVFVQKVITEVYIFTDINEQVFGEHTFQDMVVLGPMTKEKLARLLNRQRRKRQKGS
jgi:hypothetical protein